MVFFHQEGQVEADYDDQISRQPVEPHDLHQVFNLYAQFSECGISSNSFVFLRNCCMNG